MKMNSTDRWLIDRWSTTKALEDAMNSTRQRYEELFQEVRKSVQQIHPELDRMDIHLSPKEVDSYGGNVVFSKASWISDWDKWRTGIYVWGTTLDELTSSKGEEPRMYIYLQVKKSDSRIEDFRRRIAGEAPNVFKLQTIQYKTNEEGENRTLLWYQIPEGRRGLLKKLTDGAEQAFVDCITEHVSLLSGFIPVLDKLFEK